MAYIHITFKKFKKWVWEKYNSGNLDNHHLEICLHVMDKIDGEWFFLRERYWQKNHEKFILDSIVNPIEEIICETINHKKEQV